MPESRGRKSPPTTQPLLRRLDDAAEHLNPILIVIVIGLAILNFSVFAALELRNLPLRHVPVTSDDAPPSTPALGTAIGLPQR